MKIKTMVKAVALSSLILGGAQAASADQMFLKAQDYRPAVKAAANVHLLNGTFEISANAVAVDRIKNVRIVAGGKVTTPSESQWKQAKSFSTLSFAAEVAGTYVVGLSTKPRVIEMDRNQFVGYMAYEGMKDALATFIQDSKLTSVRERYSKHVRTFMQVGDQKTDDYKASLGHPLEIMLEDNPYNLRFGKTVKFQVLLNGKPLANQSVKASYEGFHAHNTTGGHITSYNVKTDDQGRASFLLSNKAVWYISLINMQPVNDGDADYESNWATVTFDVK
ncbi:MAG: hypothetical protein COB54_00180 [Alphaproteobacteria bacterium]|nr:MAG: hypothetical protein COB54_00180 [Alphaproteobacteria bacterium]